ncbi:hypothetical protein GW17_00002632 [Ensete ventricosum]|nr:hypothetical protein GW17_00002632 [Ensete ventricosum]
MGRPRAIAARGSLAHRPRPRAILLPREEKDRGLVGKVDFTVRHLSSSAESFPSSWTGFSRSQSCISSSRLFCASAFAYYSQATAAQEIFGHTLQSLRGIKYLYKDGGKEDQPADSSSLIDVKHRRHWPQATAPAGALAASSLPMGVAFVAKRTCHLSASIFRRSKDT